jgi:nicotinamidase-related amidase
VAGLQLDLDTAALVLVDVTNGMLTVEMAPHSAETVLANAVKLADGFREAGCTVVLTTAALPVPPSARARVAPPAPPERDLSALAKVATVPDWRDPAPGLGPEPGDLFVQKPAWSAFFATDLDLQLRRRGVRTLVVGGIATNFGAESTARDGRYRGYDIVLAEDASRALTAEEHQHACRYTFPMMGRVRTTDEILKALG